MNSSSEISAISSIEPEVAPPVESKVKMSPELTLFIQELGELHTPEEKIIKGLHFMRSSLAQEGSPRFREFWEARREILAYFKENLNPAIRSRLWEEYVELTVEARRLKDILEEQSSFAMEQIDLAIRAIEADLIRFPTLVSEAPAIVFPFKSMHLAPRFSLYNEVQIELNLLNALASRLNSFRREVVKTDMRIRVKTKFFKKLSDLGDQIFPKRKEKIEWISLEFQKDVNLFLDKYFAKDDVVGAPYYVLREEIKALQAIAKVLTLNSVVFNHTRLQLSQCWDRVKVLEKEYKQEAVEKRQASFDKKQLIQTLIQELSQKSAELPLKELDREIDRIGREIRGISFYKEDAYALREELAKLRAPHVQAQEQRARDLELIEKEKLQAKKEKLVAIHQEISSLIKEGSLLDMSEFESRFQALQANVAGIEFFKTEKQAIDRSFRILKDLIEEKKEQALLNLSDDEKEALANLRFVLAQKKERRQEVKDQLQNYRKSIGSSNLDFEKAMLYRELMDQEKERLDKVNASIQEIEGKIEQMEG